MIYLDNSATTRPYDAVIDRMDAAMREQYFNASAAYGPALSVEKEVRRCRKLIAGALGVQEAGICFTAGGTESDNLAILGTAEAIRKPTNMVVSAIEHPAVAETMRRAERLGYEIRVIPIADDGRIDLKAAEQLIDAETALVSCMQVSNESGAIQPVAELSAIAKKANPAVRVHVDGVQGFLRVPVNLSKSGIDYYALSGHKIHGPKGIGVLAMRPCGRLVPQMSGGGQESGLRSGTCDAPAILGLHEAVRLSLEEGMIPEIRAMKLRLWEQLREEEGIRANGPDPENESLAAPHIISLSFDGVRGEVMRNALEGEGILVSTGSACASHKQKVSPTLLAMGLSPAQADGTIRVSLGRFNKPEEMDRAADAMRRIYRQLKRYQRR